MLPPADEICSEIVRASWPWKNSPPPRCLIAPSVAASSDWTSVLPSRALPRMRRASPSASMPAPACMSRESARDTGTPKRASRSAGATTCSQRDAPCRTCIKVMARTPLGTEKDEPLIGPGAAIGAKTNASACLVLSSWTMQAPEAPRLAAEGKVTDSAKYIAAAASVALPPLARMSRPISVARLSSDVAAAKLDVAVTRDSGARLGGIPAGFAAFAARSISRLVSFVPQADSKKAAAVAAATLYN